MKRKAGALLLAVTLVLAACGSDDDPVLGQDTTTTPAAVDAPERIVSLSPTSTEMLFAIGAGDLVVAVDDQSNFPDEAPTTDLSGYEPNLEAIAQHDPDLVVTSSSDPTLVDGLAALDIEVLVHDAAVEIDDVFAQLEELGDVTGHRAEALDLTSQMRADITEIRLHAVDRAPLTAYWELDPTYYSITSETFIGTLLRMVNVTSIADAVQDKANGYPQLSAEFILQADPDLVLLADTKCCQQDAAAIGARPGWGTMKAVANGNVVELDDDVASRWGPRIVELLELIDQAAERAAGT